MGYGGTWVHEVAGDPLSVVIAGGALSINNKQPWALATLSARIEDPAASITIANDDEWVSTFDGVTVFAGDVNQVVQTDHGRSGPRVYNITAQDYTARLKRSTVTGDRDVTESFRDRVLWIMSFDTTGLAADTFVEDIAGTVDAATTTGKTVMEALEEVRSAAGATMYVDFDKELHFFVTESNPAPFDLDAFWGFSLTSETGDPDPIRSGSLTIIRPGIQSGMQARVVNPLWSLDETFDITEVATTVLDPNDTTNTDRGGQAEFVIRFGHVIPDTVADIVSAVSSIGDQVQDIQECCDEMHAGNGVMPGLIAPYITDPDKNFWGFNGAWDPRNGAPPGFVADPGADCGGHVYVGAYFMESFAAAGTVLIEPHCENFGDYWRVGSPYQPSDPGDYESYKNTVTDRVFYDFGSVGYSGMLKVKAIKVTDSALPPTTAHLRVRNLSWTAPPAHNIDLPDGLEYPITSWGLQLTASGYRYWAASLDIPVAGFRQIVFDSLDYWYTDGPFFIAIDEVAMAAQNENPPPGHPTVLIGAGPSDGVTTSYTTVSPYRPGSLEVLVGGLPWTTDGYVETDPAAKQWDFTQTPIVGTQPEDNLIEYRYVTR